MQTLTSQSFREIKKQNSQKSWYQNSPSPFVPTLSSFCTRWKPLFTWIIKSKTPSQSRKAVLNLDKKNPNSILKTIVAKWSSFIWMKRKNCYLIYFPHKPHMKIKSQCLKKKKTMNVIYYQAFPHIYKKKKKMVSEGDVGFLI